MTAAFDPRASGRPALGHPRAGHPGRRGEQYQGGVPVQAAPQGRAARVHDGRHRGLRRVAGQGRVDVHRQAG